MMVQIKRRLRGVYQTAIAKKRGFSNADRVQMTFDGRIVQSGRCEWGFWVVGWKWDQTVIACDRCLFSNGVCERGGLRWVW